MPFSGIPPNLYSIYSIWKVVPDLLGFSIFNHTIWTIIPCQSITRWWTLMPAVALKFYTLNKTYKVEDTSTYQYNPWLLKHARVKFYWTMNMYTITNDNNDTGIAITSMLRLIRCKYYTNVWYVMAAAACLIWKYTFVWLFDYCSYGLVWSGRLSIPNYESVSTVSCHVRYRVALVSGLGGKIYGCILYVRMLLLLLVYDEEPLRAPWLLMIGAAEMQKVWLSMSPWRCLVIADYDRIQTKIYSSLQIFPSISSDATKVFTSEPDSILDTSISMLPAASL